MPPRCAYARTRAERVSRCLAATALLVVACSTGSDRAEPGTRTEDSAGAVDTVGAGSDSARTAGSICLTGEPFIARGSIPVRTAAPADAYQVGALRWEPHEGCERLVIDLLTADGAPAERAGNVTAAVLRESGVVRVSLHDVEGVTADATDAAFDGSLAGAAFAVRSAAGNWIDVDAHLTGAAEAHVSTLDAPARVIVDLRPGGGAIPVPAHRTNLVVVLQPRAGSASYPLTVTGYARTFEANVVVRIEQDGRDIDERFTTATGWVDAWGAWAFEIESGPTGAIVLHVGEYSARDGEWQGVAIPLQMRPRP